MSDVQKFSVATLPPIEAPQGAISEAHQHRAVTTVTAPRGIHSRLHHSIPVNVAVPHEKSAMWFKELHCGYLSAQSVLVSKYATDTVKLLASETAELTAAAAAKTAAVDNSLPPRSLAVWLLANVDNGACPHVDTFLDAFSTYANFKVGTTRVVNSVRMSALFGADAIFLLDQVKKECIGSSVLEMGCVRLLIRWNTGFEMRSAWRDMPHRCADSGLSALRSLQDTVVRMCGVEDAPFPPTLSQPVSDPVCAHAFYNVMVSVSKEFFDLLEGDACIHTSDFVKAQNDTTALQPTSVFVRVVDKRLGKDGITNSSSFHGALLGLNTKLEQIRAFVEETDEHGLRLPISKMECELGLHLCAVQAEGLQLGRTVSLFGTLGIAGQPIHSPNSWVWVSRPAVRPIDASLLNDFALFPCDKDSLLPGRQELVPSFERFWKQTSNIFKMLHASEPVMSMSASTDSIDTIRLPSPQAVLTPEPELKQEDLFVLAAMQLDLKSKRTTLGEAYAFIFNAVGPNAITDNMKQSMADLGVRASLFDMLQHNKRAIQSYRDADENKRKHAEILASLCTAAIDMTPGAKKARTIKPKEPVCMPAERMRRCLKTCSLKGGEHLTLEMGVQFNDTALCGLVLSSIIADDIAAPEPAVLALIKRPITKLGGPSKGCTWLARVEQAVAVSVATAAVALRSTSARAFLVVRPAKVEDIYIKTVELNGAVHGALLDDMCRVQSPRVVILQELDEKRVRVTATVKIA